MRILKIILREEPKDDKSFFFHKIEINNKLVSVNFRGG